MTEDELLWCLDGDAPFWAGLGVLGTRRLPPARRSRRRAVERLGLPGFAFSDGPRGVVIGNATCFPVSMARGATWDPDLEERIGDAIGRELRAVGRQPLPAAVCVNVLRHPAWGRAQETYGEDPHHVGELGAALTRGVQRHVMACVKHFACNSMENARFTVDVEVDDVALHEVYLPHFRRIVDEGVASVMSRLQRVNGEWCGAEPTRCSPTSCATSGASRASSSATGSSGCATPARRCTAGLDIEMPYRMVRAPAPAGRARAGEVVVGRRRPRRRRGSSPRCCASTTCSPRRRRRADVLGLRRAPGAGPGGRPPGRSSCCATSRSTARPCCRSTRRRSARSRWSAGWPTPCNLGDGGSSDVWALECRDRPRRAAGGAARCRGVTTTGPTPTRPPTAAAGRRRRRRRRLHLPSTRASTSARRHRSPGRRCSPGPTTPSSSTRFEASVAADARPPTKPPGVGRPGGGAGFGTGGDRSVAAAADRRRRAHPGRRRRQPPHRRRRSRPAARC